MSHHGGMRLFLRSILLAGLATFAVGAMAQTKPPQHESPTRIKCAVEPRDPVNIAAATKKGLFADHKGRRYYFCCAGCKPKFAADPAKYAKGASTPIPKKVGK